MSKKKVLTVPTAKQMRALAMETRRQEIRKQKEIELCKQKEKFKEVSKYLPTALEVVLYEIRKSAEEGEVYQKFDFNFDKQGKFVFAFSDWVSIDTVDLLIDTVLDSLKNDGFKVVRDKYYSGMWGKPSVHVSW